VGKTRLKLTTLAIQMIIVWRCCAVCVVRIISGVLVRKLELLMLLVGQCE
jgi:hypothetical protein